MKKSVVFNNKGFTLVELLVVISIISLISSIVLGGITVQRVLARNSHRQQEVRQIDTAIQLYMSTNNKVPDLLGTCGSGAFGFPDSTIQERCIAMSNGLSGTQEASAWTALMSELQPYLKSAPKDPCPSCRTYDVRNKDIPPANPGYVYVTPAALHYYCVFGNGGGSEFCNTQTIDSTSYQIYAPLEDKSSKGISDARSTAEKCFLLTSKDPTKISDKISEFALKIFGVETVYASLGAGPTIFVTPDCDS